MTNLNKDIIPSDSFLHGWIDRFSHTEVYPSWTILTGLAVVGCLLGRKMCFDAGQVGLIWPNMSVLLVGPSGHGKDTIITPACELLDFCGAAWIRGTTMEAVKENMVGMGDPAVGFINASELADFLGCKDYQAGMVQALTNILTTGTKLDVSLKSDIAKGIKRTILHPTLTMFAGSTADWLQSMLPDGSLDGGFIPRFVVAAEWSKKDAGILPIANPGKYETQAQHQTVLEGEIRFLEECLGLVKRVGSIPSKYLPIRFSETCGDDDAEGWYENWYINRYRTFSPLLQAYAHRSSGLMRRLGLLMAVTRGHNWIEEADYHFADAVIQHTAERLEQAVIPQSREVKVGYEILRLLPATHADLLRGLAAKYSSLWVRRGLQYLIESNQVEQQEGMFQKI